MVSNIDKTKPVTGIDQPAQVIRDNFIIANIEITELQARKFDSDGSSSLTGPLGLVFFTLAGLPPAIDNEGSLVYVTDSSPPSPFYSDGLIWRSTGLSAIVDDTTPQLGGDLDVNGFGIISVSNGDISITPDGSGSVILDGLDWPQADGTVGQALTTDGFGNLSFAAGDPAQVVQTLADGANIAWDHNTSRTAKVTLAGNRTLDNPTNSVEGLEYTIKVVQDGTGSRTLAYGSAYKFAGGTPPTLTAAPNAVDVLRFWFDGTDYIKIGFEVNVS